MIALLLCLIAGIAGFAAGRRSLGAGCLAVIATGYAYGIVRANLITPFSHFTFDAALMGLYASQFLAPKNKAEEPQNNALRMWLIVLVIWPVLLIFLPFQPLLVSLVGLRGNMYLFPVLLLGSRLRNSDLRMLAIGLAVLNAVTLVFGAAEYRLGLERFFPYSAVTAIMYESRDGAGLMRIPSTFGTAHLYASAMVGTLPFLFGYWVQRAADLRRKLLLALGIGSALFGVVLAATRVGMIAAAVVVLVAGSSSKLGTLKRWGLALAVGAVIFAAVHNERWQRYRELDKDTVTERISGSVNRTFLEVLFEYPMGNGLGGGGTSIPYFLGSDVNRPVVVENEYSRILLEQGLVGLLIWVAFIVWFLTNRSAFVRGEWSAGRRIAWWLTVFTLASSVIGTGLLTAIPGTFLLLLAMGWVSVKPMAARETQAVAPRRVSGIPAVATMQMR